MLDAVAALLTYQAGNLLRERQRRRRGWAIGIRAIVPYETFAASDGDFVLAVGNDEQWRRFCARRRNCPRIERFATNRQRVTGYDELRPFVADRLRTQPRQHWIERLNAAGVPCGSVRNLQELFDDPQLAAREMIARVEHATIGAAADCSACPSSCRTRPGACERAPPTLGQHTDAVLLRVDLGHRARDAVDAAARGTGI